ncbi:MAG: hypothetical protein Q9M76_05500 [Candidatus Dojkabacteria bacterium]|nr:hypothetical protein [Candidatus Dojkabacteria bacterium]
MRISKKFISQNSVRLFVVTTLLTYGLILFTIRTNAEEGISEEVSNISFEINKISNSNFAILDNGTSRRIAELDENGIVVNYLTDNQYVITAKLSDDNTKLIYTFGKDSKLISLINLVNNTQEVLATNISDQVLVSISADNNKVAYSTPRSVDIINLTNGEVLNSYLFDQFGNNSGVLYTPEVFFNNDSSKASFVIQSFEEYSVIRESISLDI